MSLNLSESKVSLQNDQFKPMLRNLQANILKFHGRSFAHHLFFVFDEYKIEEAKEWIRDFASDEYKKVHITSARKQLTDSEQRGYNKSYDGGTVYTLSLSGTGFRKLNVMPQIDNSAPVMNGLRASAGLLKDNPDSWQTEFQNPIDMLIIVANTDAYIAADDADSIINQVSSFANCVLNQRGNVLKMHDTNVGIEHFGYADGISQPIYFTDEIAKQDTYTEWHDETPLERVLVKEHNSVTGDCFGSYLVFRKLEQNVKCFKIAEGDADPDPAHPECKRILPHVKNEAGTDDDELPGAMIVGRFENSTPVTLSSEEFTPDPHDFEVTNDFDYSKDKLAMKCPYHAHIRLMNPRNGDPKESGDSLLVHRITRRGITFDDHDRDHKRIPDDDILDITEDMLKTNQPEGDVGLLFMCYQNNIANQFEILQAFWANQGLIGGPPVKGEDSLISQGVDLPRFLPEQWGQPKHSPNFQFSGFVKMKGGEYFYTPSIPFLQNL